MLKRRKRESLKVIKDLKFQPVSKRDVEEAATSFGIPLDKAIEMRDRYLDQSLEKLRKYLKSCYLDLQNHLDDELWTGVIKCRIHEVCSMISKLKQEHRRLHIDYSTDHYGENIAKALRVPMEQVLGDLVIGKRVKCPFHDDRHPSATIFSRENRLYCFACSQIWDTIQVTMQLKNLTFKEAVHVLLANF